MDQNGSTEIRHRKWEFKTRELLIIVIFTNVLGNVALSHGMHQQGPTLSTSIGVYLHAMMNPWVIIGVVTLTFWMMSYLALLSRADLSFVLPVTASGYILVALMGHFVLHETISATRWAGILLLTIGVGIVGLTPARTVDENLMDEAPAEELTPEERR